MDNMDNMDGFVRKVVSRFTGGSLSKNEAFALILSHIVKLCGISPDGYYIIGSYAIKNYVTLGDLDIIMLPEEWEKLNTCGLGIYEEYKGQKRYLVKLPDIAPDAEFEIFSKPRDIGFPNKSFSFDNAELVRDEYDHLHFSVNTFIDFKTTMHRDKDRSHLEHLFRQDVCTDKLGAILCDW